MGSAINAEPKAVAGGILRVIERNGPDRGQVRDLCRRLLQRHSSLRLRPVVSSEEVVEAYYRCVITESLVKRYGLSEAAIPDCINSSHRAVRRVCAAPGHSHVRIDDCRWQ